MLRPEELPHYVYDDYVLWKGRWELIEGIPFSMTPSPSYRHQRISQKIGYLLEQGLQEREHCQALLPTDWKVTEDTVVQPDNMVICYQPSTAFLTKAPSLIFEILSPATVEKDRHTKYSIYEREGVTYYCIVDPENNVAKLYRLRDGKYVKQMDATDESFEFDLGKCKIALDFASIWCE